MIIAGKTLDVHMSDGTTHRVAITVRDENQFEREQKTSLAKLCTIDGEISVPSWVAWGVMHCALVRTGADVPTELSEFEEQVVDFDEVAVGKAVDSAPDQLTG